MLHHGGERRLESLFLLLRLREVGETLGPLLSLANEAGIDARLAQREESSLAVLLSLRNGTELQNGRLLLDGQKHLALVLLDVLELLRGRVQLPGTFRGLVAREDNEFRSIGLQAIDVQFEGFFGEVGAAVIDGNTDGSGKSSRNTGGLQLVKSKTTSQPLLDVVFASRRTNNRAKLSGKRAGENASGLFRSLNSTAPLFFRVDRTMSLQNVPNLCEDGFFGFGCCVSS